MNIPSEGSVVVVTRCDAMKAIPRALARNLPSYVATWRVVSNNFFLFCWCCCFLSFSLLDAAISCIL